MSATVVYYPESYIELLTLLKDRVLSGRAASFPRSNVQIGISTNFNKICGCVLQVRLLHSHQASRVFLRYPPGHL
jgi:hypothetical protein